MLAGNNMKRSITVEELINHLMDCRAVIIDNDLLVYPSVNDDKDEDSFLVLSNDPTGFWAEFDWDVSPVIIKGDVYMEDTQGREYQLTLLSKTKL